MKFKDKNCCWCLYWKVNFVSFFDWRSIAHKTAVIVVVLLSRQMESTAKGLAMAISVLVLTTVRRTVGEVMAANEWRPELITGVANTSRVAQNPSVVALPAKVQIPVIQVTPILRYNAKIVWCKVPFLFHHPLMYLKFVFLLVLETGVCVLCQDARRQYLLLQYFFQ